MILKFFGAECRIGDAPALNRLGQTVEVGEAEARELIAGDGHGGGPALLPAEDFDTIFTPEDVASGFASDVKRAHAALALAELRQEAK